MRDCNEKGIIIAEVRGGVQLKGKLLFRLGTYQDKMVILLKRHGEEECYLILVEDLLDPFVEDKEALKKATTFSKGA